jgi:hypothetical protein
LSISATAAVTSAFSAAAAFLEEDRFGVGQRDRHHQDDGQCEQTDSGHGVSLITISEKIQITLI